MKHRSTPVLFALIWSERNAPIITKPITLIGLIEFGRSIPDLIKRLEKQFSRLSF